MRHNYVVINSEGKIGEPRVFRVSDRTLKKIMDGLAKSIQEGEDKYILEELLKGFEDEP